MSKTFTITVKESPPCEFESLEDLKYYIETHEQKPSDVKWSDAIRYATNKNRKPTKCHHRS